MRRPRSDALRLRSYLFAPPDRITALRPERRSLLRPSPLIAEVPRSAIGGAVDALGTTRCGCRRRPHAAQRGGNVRPDRRIVRAIAREAERVARAACVQQRRTEVPLTDCLAQTTFAPTAAKDTRSTISRGRPSIRSRRQRHLARAGALPPAPVASGEGAERAGASGARRAAASWLIRAVASLLTTRGRLESVVSTSRRFLTLRPPRPYPDASHDPRRCHLRVLLRLLQLAWGSMRPARRGANGNVDSNLFPRREEVFCL